MFLLSRLGRRGDFLHRNFVVRLRVQFVNAHPSAICFISSGEPIAPSLHYSIAWLSFMLPLNAGAHYDILYTRVFRFVQTDVAKVFKSSGEKSILVEADLFLAIKLQPDLIIQAILQVASILRSELKLKWNQISIARNAPHIWRIFFRVFSISFKDCHKIKGCNVKFNIS